MSTRDGTAAGSESTDDGGVVRGVDGELLAARRRVASFFAAVGLPPSKRLTRLVDTIVADARRRDEQPIAVTAVATAQARTDRFARGVFGPEPTDDSDADGSAPADPARLRALLSAGGGEHFPENIEAAKTLVHSRDKAVVTGDIYAGFAAQSFGRARFPRWLLGLLVPLTLTAAATVVLTFELAAGGLLAFELLWAVMFAFAFFLCMIGFFVAALGFVLSRRRRPPSAAPIGELPRTAVLMPIYHEDPDQVFGAVVAMRNALARMPAARRFEFFVLSDSQQPAKIVEEERALRWARQTGNSAIPLYYRRRLANVGKKSGNLADFFERWGDRYVYAIVLDADSVLRAETMLDMVSRMEGEPRLGLLQAPLAIHHARTVLARSQQFVGSCAGPLFQRGLAAWADDQGNYYGHNAVIRVRAFLECCALPMLHGQPPLGGHILSHDFVEAALLCRAGWAVRMADDLEGSWEEFPPTVPQYVERDRRWCQGEMQHLRILLVEGFRPMSRIHLFVGACSYLAGPAWFLFLVTGLVVSAAGATSAVSPRTSVILLVATLVALLGPRLLGWIAVITDRQRRADRGGFVRCTASVLLEMIFAALLAPLLMVHQTRAVLAVLGGRAVQWGAQRRRAAGSSALIARGEIASTIAGVVLAGLGLWFAPRFFWWLAPVWLPLLLAIPIALVASSVSVGLLLRRWGLLLAPAETQPDPLDERAEALRAHGHAQAGWMEFRDTVLDPVLLDLHCATLPTDGRAGVRAADLQRLREHARDVGPADLPPEQRRLLASDPVSLRWLHRHAWRWWPIESWEPTAPPEAVSR